VDLLLKSFCFLNIPNSNQKLVKSFQILKISKRLFDQVFTNVVSSFVKIYKFNYCNNYILSQILLENEFNLPLISINTISYKINMVDVVLPDFKKFLSERELVLQYQNTFYAQWVGKFLAFFNNHA